MAAVFQENLFWKLSKAKIPLILGEKDYNKGRRMAADFDRLNYFNNQLNT